MIEKQTCTAIVVAAGTGKRMGSTSKKQYMELMGKPVLYYSLRTLQRSGIIDDILLVVGKDDIDYVKKEIVDQYGFTKIFQVVSGGKERYDSVWHGLLALPKEQNGYVFIQDGARPFISEEILRRGYDAVSQYQACVAGMPSRDTVKLENEQGFSASTLNRDRVWLIQTPQVFEISLIKEAYRRFMEQDYREATDDAMVVEQTMRVPIKLFKGSYDNFKITTPEDLELARGFLNERAKS